jgi:hypothetical protein
MGKSLEIFKGSKLHKGEQIISFAEGYIGKMMGSGKDTQYNGDLVLTDQRLVFYAKRVFLTPEVYKSMPLKQISSINFTAGWIKKTIELVTNNDFLEFKFLGNKEVIEEFQKAVESTRDKIMNTTNTQPTIVNDSIPDQIKKLAELKDLGILTEDEFNTKKQELLAKM